MKTTTASITALAERVQYIEDELALRNLMVRYGLAVDCGDTATAVACHTGDAVYVVSAPRSGRDEADSGATDLTLKGAEAIGNMLDSPLHQSLLPCCAHTVGPVTLEISGDEARATGYSRLYNVKESTPHLQRLAINEWRFRRDSGQWRIARRESRLVGEDQAQALLRQAAWRPRATKTGLG
ncbi:nuclear transport factor 2 family protein [Parahaliea mediterranea]|uniref:Nuclear transport factor 2 family protein n=1 Tax=Parahaliea mediterranea TaxID=651086 RepID=A0A939IHG0_9GAMM|nr:nuclear transport factor 2 family protein [Parahaliea mediterranea]MBN7795389.1 nuclear transport factor 2 family protein [Parahaliea mediterranea]